MLTVPPTLLTTLAALGGVLLLIAAAGLIARKLRFGAWMQTPKCGRAMADLALVHSLALDRTRRVHVLRWRGREILLLTGGVSDRVLGDQSLSELPQ